MLNEKFIVNKKMRNIYCNFRFLKDFNFVIRTTFQTFYFGDFFSLGSYWGARGTLYSVQNSNFLCQVWS